MAKRSKSVADPGKQSSFLDHLSRALIAGAIAGIVIGLTEIALTTPLFVQNFLNFGHGVGLGSKISLHLLFFPTICYVVSLICMNLLVAAVAGLIAGMDNGFSPTSDMRLYTLCNTLFISLFMASLLLVEKGKWLESFLNRFGTVGFVVVCLIVLALFLSGNHLLFRLLPRKRFYRNAVTIAIPLFLVGTLIFISRKRESGVSPDAESSSDTLLRSEERRDNVLLITIDTQRADYIGAYDKSRDITPNIDRLSTKGVRFDLCVSQATVTLPSHTSILTATYPIFHGVRTNSDYMAGPSLITLAEVLKENGFRTGAFVSAFVLDSRFGLDQGFDVYDSNASWASILFTSFVKRTVFSNSVRRILSLESNPVERSAEATNEKVVDWLREKDERSFFVWVHYFDPHTYSPPQEYRDRFLALLDGNIDGEVTISTSAGEKQLSRARVERHKLLYQAEVSYTDASIGNLLESLEQLDLLKNTLVVLTADHGESFGENKNWGHGTALNIQALHIPLVFYRPGRLPQGVVVDGLSQSVDIMPTILDYLEIEGPEEMQGSSLLPYFENETTLPDRSSYCEAMTPIVEEEKLMGLATESWKYVMTPWGSEEELFDLREDPEETANVARARPELALQMKARLESIVETMSSTDKEQRIELDEEAEEALRALGYLQ